MNKYHHDLVKLYNTNYNSFDKAKSLDYLISKFGDFNTSDSDRLTCKKFLGDYSFFGQYPHLQLYALKSLIDSLRTDDIEFLQYFKRYLDLINGLYLARLKEYAGQEKNPPIESSISDYFISTLEFLKVMISYSMLGYLKLMGNEAYPYFVDLICDSENDSYFRSHALARLCQYSGYEFADFLALEVNGYMKLLNAKDGRIFHDERCESTLYEILNQPIILGNWNQLDTDRIIKKIKEWSQMGYPAKAQTEFTRDIALDTPHTPLEKICCQMEIKIREQDKLALDKTLKEYERELDTKRKKLLKNPHAYDDTEGIKNLMKSILDLYLEKEKKTIFFKARAIDMEKIDKRWGLPSLYREFLLRFSSHHFFDIGSSYNSIKFASADRLEDQQKNCSIIKDPKWSDPSYIGEYINFTDHIPYIDNAKWHEKYLVIAEYTGGRIEDENVFIIDLSISNDIDAPIYFVKSALNPKLHKVANSFFEFLEKVAEGKNVTRTTKD